MTNDFYVDLHRQGSVGEKGPEGKAGADGARVGPKSVAKWYPIRNI